MSAALIDRDYRFDDTVDSDWAVATDPRLGQFPSGYNRFETVKSTDEMGPYTAKYDRFRVLARDGAGTLKWHNVYGVSPGQSNNGSANTRGNVEKAIKAANARNRKKMEQFRLAQTLTDKALQAGAEAYDRMQDDRAEASAAAAETARIAERKAGYERAKSRLPRVQAKMKASGKGISSLAATLAVAAEDATGQPVDVEQVTELATAAEQGLLDDDVAAELFPLPENPKAVAEAINAADPIVYNFFWRLKLAGVI